MAGTGAGFTRASPAPSGVNFRAFFEQVAGDHWRRMAVWLTEDIRRRSAGNIGQECQSAHPEFFPSELTAGGFRLPRAADPGGWGLSISGFPSGVPSRGRARFGRIRRECLDATIEHHGGGSHVLAAAVVDSVPKLASLCRAKFVWRGGRGVRRFIGRLRSAVCFAPSRLNQLWCTLRGAQHQQLVFRADWSAVLWRLSHRVLTGAGSFRQVAHHLQLLPRGKPSP